ncbi:MAG: 50S ribosomal protein L25/general stress protein Ctc [Robiginitomaculum sp.]|nr:MAG: 50S ribosomal protein L25/general stress protein Ctc [Robiginitomaculum sp.]
MADILLTIDVRERTGTGGARQTRREGLIPGIIYGGKLGNVAISLKENEVRKALNSGDFIAQTVTIDHKGEKQLVLTRDIQYHPVTDVPMHVDLYRVDADQMIEVEVAVRFINEEESPGLKRGGVLNVVRHELALMCPAGDIPDAIEIDLTGYDIGDSAHISSVELPKGVTSAITDRDFTIVTVVGSRAAISEADEEAEAEAAAEALAEAAEGGEDGETAEGGEE